MARNLRFVGGRRAEERRGGGRAATGRQSRAGRRVARSLARAQLPPFGRVCTPILTLYPAYIPLNDNEANSCNARHIYLLNFERVRSDFVSVP